MSDLQNLNDADAEQMKRIEKALVDALVPFMSNTNPLIGVIALTRCLRTMLRNLNRENQKTILPVVEDFIRGRVTPRHEGLLWLPGEPKVN